MSVVVLIPVLNRPQNVRPLLTSLGDVDTHFIVSPNDHDEEREIVKAGGTHLRVEWQPGPGDYAKKMNAGYRFAESYGYDWVFTGADDLRFHDGWLDKALQHDQPGVGVIGTNDMWNPLVRRGRHSTHSLVRVSYVRDIGGGWDGPGVLLHEGYDHQWVDNELVTAAILRGAWAHARDSMVEHLHPFAKKGEMDSTYEKALARGKQDGILFRSRFMRAQAEAKAARR